jgi:hypothetical protein
VFSTAFELRGADLPFYSWREKQFFLEIKKVLWTLWSHFGAFRCR